MAGAETRTVTVTTPSDTQILITREFDAPRHLVFRAFTTPELVKRWWAGVHGTVTVAEIDLRVGGGWRYVLVAHDGTEVAFHGEYREIVPDERIVNTEVYEGVPDGDADPLVVTNTFTETAPGRTTLTMLSDASSKEMRDAILDSGMEHGLQGSMDMLEAAARSLA